MAADVLIVGGGLAGLSCARTLTRAGISALIVEADDDVGGRARTDQIDGFLLDRGFQVFPTAYPEAQHIFDYEGLGLQKFYPGALVRFREQFHLISDPFRQPLRALRSILNPIGTISDKLRVALWRKQVFGSSIQDLFEKAEMTTIDHLWSLGFSDSMINRFFRPFFGGVFMDQSLTTSSRMADFVFRMFASGDISLPAQGIGSLAQQLASDLHSERIRKSQRAITIQRTSVTLESGEILTGRCVVLAIEGPTASQLVPEYTARPYRHVTCLYFSAPRTPITGPYLILNGEQKGIINSMCVLTEVSRSFAPRNQHLISVTTRENAGLDENVEETVRKELASWFGAQQVEAWRHIQTYRIPQAQPDQSPPFQTNHLSYTKLYNGLYLCGDHCSTATFDGAIGSGRRTAEEIISKLVL